jgi:hypothetical protein
MITEENYYAVNNKGLSQSKIKMYAKDPNYMYRGCITGELKKKDAKHFMIGSEVDGILTEMDKRDNVIISPYDDYRTKEAREWKEDMIAAGKIPCKQDEYEDIMAIAIAVQETEVWQDIEKNFTTQEIIQIPDNTLGEHFDCRYGKPDAYKINEDGICELLDLKTSVTVDKDKFFYKAKDLGYFTQLKYYSQLLQEKYPQIKGFRYWFMVAEKSEPFRVVLFSIPVELVEREESDLRYLIAEISERTDWSRPSVRWYDAIKLTDPRSSDWDDDGEE